MLLKPGDILEEVNFIWVLGEPLFDCSVEDASEFVIHIVEGSVCPAEEWLVFLVEYVHFFEDVLTDMLGHGGLRSLVSNRREAK